MSLGLLTSTIRAAKTLNVKDMPAYAHRVIDVVSGRLMTSSEDAHKYSDVSRRKTRLEFVLLASAVCGIEFCYAAETALVSPTLLHLGLPVAYMTTIWCLSPVVGLLLGPLLGSLSDRCHSRFGRRRPFIALLSLGIILGLLLVPHGESLGVMLGDKTVEDEETGGDTDDAGIIGHSGDTDYADATEGLGWAVTTLAATIAKTIPLWGVAITALGTALLDFSCDTCQSPCRTFLLDVSLPEDHAPGLTTFTVMAGLGGSLGYVIGGIDWETLMPHMSLGGHVRTVFSIVLIFYLICAGVTLTSFREIPLDDLRGGQCERSQRKKKRHSRRRSDVDYRKFTNDPDDVTSSSDNDEEGYNAPGNENRCTGCKTQDINLQPLPSHETESKITLKNGLQSRDVYGSFDVRSKLQGEMQSGTVAVPPSNDTDQHQHQQQSAITMTTGDAAELSSTISVWSYLMSIMKAPRFLLTLCLTNMFSWMSLVCYSLYFTDFVGQSVFGGDPTAGRGTQAYTAYEEGVRFGSLAMALYSASCSAYSLNLERLVRRFKARNVYMLSQLVYTAGALVIAVTRHRITAMLLSPCAGVMYATLFTMPYMLVAQYHTDNTFAKLAPPRGAETGGGGGVTSSDIIQPIRGLGTDVALVSSMVFVAQFVLNIFIGSVVHVTGSPTTVMYAAAILSACGAACASRVSYVDI